MVTLALGVNQRGAQRWVTGTPPQHTGSLSPLPEAQVSSYAVSFLGMGWGGAGGNELEHAVSETLLWCHGP